MLFETFTAALAQSLSEPLPGLEAQVAMFPEERKRLQTVPIETARKSAVLLLFYESQGQIYLPLIQRPPYDGTHGGQIGLPGGGQEPGDESFTRTALREAQEEIGVKATDIAVLGNLSPLYIPPSNYWVQPVVGALAYEPTFYPDPHEVAEVIPLTTQELVNEFAVGKRTIEVRGRSKETVGYALGGKWVWGATAIILAELIAVLNGMKNRQEM